MITVLSIIVGGCLTSELYQLKKESFNEKLSGFLITQDQKQVVLVGQRYHYIFPMDNTIKNTLQWSNRTKLRATNLHFVISKNNVINGTFLLKSETNAVLSDSDKIFLLANDFKIRSDGIYYFAGKLSQGTVYESGNFRLPEAQSFKKPYYLNISYDYATTGQTLTKILMTPLAVAGDGIDTVVGAIIAAPLGIAFTTRETDDEHDKVP
ncbi:MAG: hypothetical protein KGO49_03770 [Gammaproteobacteria bacterium]|nr:hypothetical protein [Gammaproteobacteria bacterium]